MAQRRTFHRSKDLAMLQVPLQRPLNLRLGKNLDARRVELLVGLPILAGSPIRVITRAKLIAHRGRLVSPRSASGSAVYAASFVRKRKIILESALLPHPEALRFILVHELFHFVWPRLGNGSRKSFEAVLLEERRCRAGGELGESSGVKKEAWRRGSGAGKRRLWRDYVCECFCDTAAWLYTNPQGSKTVSLRKCWRDRREAWFDAATNGSWKC